MTSQNILGFGLIFLVFFFLTFVTVHFDFYPFTILVPISTNRSLAVAFLAGLCAGGGYFLKVSK